MPFESEAQRSWMHANKPDMADRWEKHTPKGKKLPRKKKKTKSESVADRIDTVLERFGVPIGTLASSHADLSVLTNDEQLIISEFDRKLDAAFAELAKGNSNG